MGEDYGQLTPGHLLARLLDQVASINQKLGAIEIQVAVHLESHRAVSRMHKALYGLLVSALSGAVALLATHWH
jgi:hypothetical protein